jgi:two-component system phosphate regulon sensor histidine kinase PhoR
LIELGHERNFLAIVNDISERKQLEQDKFEFRLEQERTRVLQGFIEQASHHFRTPITNMKTSMYVLEHIENNPEKYQQHMRALNRETERLTRLIEDLLTMLRLQKSDTEFAIEDISISQLLSEIQTIQEGRTYYPDYDWKWSIGEDPLVVVGDKQFLSRAILNIIDNAVQYTPKTAEINIGTYYDNTWLIIEISDNGMGISETDLPHIFDEFYRSNRSMEQDSTRSGLGLAITQHIIKRHRGIVHVDSEEGEGTRFQILLPRNVGWEDDAPTLPQKML